ncbi:MAG: adenylate/guanylate cyclase domain-containing protein [Thermoleophilaceae bacterium]
MVCSACGTENRAGRRFCNQCGAALEIQCPSCGAANEPGDRFCGDCGTALNGGRAALATAGAPASVPERRLVSVLFADLVGFTTMSEHRDPEEVSELLSQYFDRCRTLIERYGGTVVKFIGDAVMAVWGTPVAREDDAERAVRAALALTRAVTALGEEVGMPELRVRAGVLTGNAAVEVGAEGEGMILGDSVNTASRLQSLAGPGTVLVDDRTRRASEAAIAYEDAGTHHVKGREQPVRAHTALRVVAGTGGARRGAGVEAPFVGRDAELQAIIDVGEQSAREGRARHIAVVGEAGAGKSRLLWEYFKYVDGIKEERWWHQGRCLSYGEGVAYWALAEIVRSRAGILEEESPVTAREKLRAAVEAQVPDERERRMVEPRLAHLLRLEERPDADRADLFSGWRLFFERMAASSPVILVFEDLQWADSGLLDFVDYLLEWSADFPIFVLTLARPELRERRPSWEPLALEPLPPSAVAAMLEGLAPGLPEDLVAEISRRADGIPLYVVETIRMLQDRGALVPEGDHYVVKGDVSDLDVPESLHALVASRLDGLSTAERGLLQDASVLGQSFSAAGAAALSGRSEAEVAKLLDGLVAKQVLARDEDPRSPERGQYRFLQTLLQAVAYGTLSRHVRKSRHVAAARHLEQTWPGEAYDIAEVFASHYLEAIRADPDADDVAALRASARETLTAAGRAAASLALGPEAERYFEHAAELAEEDAERATLFEQAGHALAQSGNTEAAEKRLRAAIDLHTRGGSASGGSAAVTLANLLRYAGRVDEALVLLAPFRSEEHGVDKIVRAQALVALATTQDNVGNTDEAAPLFDDGLTTLETEQAWGPLAEGLVGRAAYLIYRHRLQEGFGILQHALSLAAEHDLPAVALRARFNLAGVALESNRFQDAVAEVNEGLTLARERGDRAWESGLLSQSVAPLVTLGRWDEATAAAAPLLAAQPDLNAVVAAASIAQVAAARGDEATLERCRSVAAERGESAHIDERVTARIVLARDAVESGSLNEVLGLTRTILDEMSTGNEFREEAYALSIEAALGLGDEDAMADLEEYVASLRPSRATPLLRAGRARIRAEQAHRHGDTDAADGFEREATELLRAIGARPLLARALLERARRRDDDDPLTDARAIYADLGASRWIMRIDEVAEARQNSTPA